MRLAPHQGQVLQKQRIACQIWLVKKQTSVDFEQFRSLQQLTNRDLFI